MVLSVDCDSNYKMHRLAAYVSDGSQGQLSRSIAISRSRTVDGAVSISSSNSTSLQTTEQVARTSMSSHSMAASSTQPTASDSVQHAPSIAPYAKMHTTGTEATKR